MADTSNTNKPQHTFCCKRCGYVASQKINLKNHLMKKTACPTSIGTFDREELIKELEKKQGIHCPHCNMSFNNYTSKYRHVEKCPMINENERKTEDQKTFELLSSKVAQLESELQAIKNTNSQVVIKQQTNQGYLYIVHCREHIRLGENIYKIGQSSNIRSRMNGYPKDSRLLFTEYFNNYITAETELKRTLRNDPNVKFCDDIGKEYFQCDLAYLKTKNERDYREI